MPDEHIFLDTQTINTEFLMSRINGKFYFHRLKLNSKNDASPFRQNILLIGKWQKPSKSNLLSVEKELKNKRKKLKSTLNNFEDFRNIYLEARCRFSLLFSSSLITTVRQSVIEVIIILTAISLLLGKIIRLAYLNITNILKTYITFRKFKPKSYEQYTPPFLHSLPQTNNSNCVLQIIKNCNSCLIIYVAAPRRKFHLQHNNILKLQL